MPWEGPPFHGVLPSELVIHEAWHKTFRTFHTNKTWPCSKIEKEANVSVCSHLQSDQKRVLFWVHSERKQSQGGRYDIPQSVAWLMRRQLSQNDCVTNGWLFKWAPAEWERSRGEEKAQQSVSSFKCLFNRVMMAAPCGKVTLNQLASRWAKRRTVNAYLTHTHIPGLQRQSEGEKKILVSN